MRRAARLGLAALPGGVLAVSALLGWAPANRDVPTYFVPLRVRTAEVLAGVRGAYWNPDVGCGEPFFANPQSALLYPPAWFAAALQPAAAVGVEAGLHLALLGVGCALLARRLGATGWLDVAAGWGVAAAGPVLDAVGVLNNLDALAWIPLMWWAALEGRAALLAGLTAACYLAAEPQLAVVAGAVAFSLAPQRRTAGALVLAVGLVGVQLVPFSYWVRGGDRGRIGEPLGRMAGTVRPGELAAFAVPGAPLPNDGADRFVTHPTVPLWVLVLAGVALADRRSAVRKLAIWGWVLVALSVLPSFPFGLTLWNAVTQGMVRYPARLLFPALVALVPVAAAAVGQRRVPRWAAGGVAAVAVLAGLLVGGAPWAVVLGGFSAGAVLASFVAVPAALAGTVAVVPLVVAALELAPTRPLPQPACARFQRGAGRVYVVAPSWEQLSWVKSDHLRRQVGLGWGYTPLVDGRRLVRTFAPLEARPLEAHLAEADRGPAGRWWLDSLAAARVVSQHPVAGFPVLCEEGGLGVYDNPRAWPEASIVCGMPVPGEPVRRCGDVLASAARDDERHWRVRVGAPRALLLWLETPDPGWHVRVDDHPAESVAGPGILHGVEVPAGEHEVSAVYRPPGLLGGAVLSVASLFVLGVLAWRHW